MTEHQPLGGQWDPSRRVILTKNVIHISWIYIYSWVLMDTVASALSDTAGFWAEQVSNSLSHTAWFFIEAMLAKVPWKYDYALVDCSIRVTSFNDVTRFCGQLVIESLRDTDGFRFETVDTTLSSTTGLCVESIVKSLSDNAVLWAAAFRVCSGRTQRQKRSLTCTARLIFQSIDNRINGTINNHENQRVREKFCIIMIQFRKKVQQKIDLTTGTTE